LADSKFAVKVSANSGATWTDWFTSANGYGKCDGVAVGPPGSNIVYAVGYDFWTGSPAKTTGAVWRLTGTATATPVATDCRGNLSALHSAYTNVDWSVSSVCLDPTRPSLVVVGTVAGVFRSTNNAVSWEATSLGAGISKLMANPAEGALYAATTTNGVYRSVDGGATWTAINRNLGNLNCTDLGLDANDKRLFVGTVSNTVCRARIGPILNIAGVTNPATGGGAGTWTNWYETAVSRPLADTVVNGTNMTAYWTLSGGQTDTNGAMAGVGSVSLTHTRDTTLTLQWLPLTASDTFVGLLAGPGGTVSPGGGAAALRGVPLSIAAIASNGYAFASWQVITGTAVIGDTNAATTTVTLDAPAIIRANFHDRKHILSTATNVAVPEGGTGTFQVKLAGVPAGDVLVVVGRQSGDADIAAQADSTNLTFTTANWDTYQTVTLAAVEDADAATGTAVVVCSAAGMDNLAVTATEVENDTILTLTSGIGGLTQPGGATVVTIGVPAGISAVASNGYVFTAWKVVSGPATIADIRAATTAVTITGPATMRAYFAASNRPPGTVWGWGKNSNAQLGDGTAINRFNPVQTVGVSNIMALAGSARHNVAIDASGRMWGWGNNTYGQLGDGTTSERLTPVQPVGISNVTAIAAGRDRTGSYVCGHTVALHSNGTVWAWGYNNAGQLGNGTTTNHYSPTQVKLSGGAPLTNIVGIVAGPYQTYAWDRGGRFWAWGRNNNSQLGDGTTTSRSYPTPVTGLSNITALAVGDGQFNNKYVVALMSNGTVWAWGENSFGQIGDGTVGANRPSPVRVTGLSNVTAIAASSCSTYARKSDGALWAWGNNYYGELGDGTTNNRTTPVQVAGLSNITAMTCNDYNAYAVGADGTVYGWGRGNLGDGTVLQRNTPVSLPGVSNAVAVAPGFDGASDVRAALTGDGTVWTWGTNTTGQLGDGTTIARSVPVPVLLEDGSTPLSGVTGLLAGASFVLAIRNAPGTEPSHDAILTVTAGPGGATVPNGAIVVTQSVARAVCAVADVGYVFTNWTVTTGSVVFGATTYADGEWTTFMTITSAATVRANFVLTAYEAWRRAHFTAEQLTDEMFSGDAADPDQDSMSNWKEYVARTDPTNGASVFAITGVTNMPYVRVQFFPSAPDRLYTLQWCTNLVEGVWRTVPGQVRVAGTGGPGELSDTNSAAGSPRFYRVRVDLPDVQDFADISAEAALAMVADRQNDPDFVVLDVRTAAEYAARHIVGAINRDYYAPDFSAQLDALDKNKAYLIHCRTGGRSGPTHDLMFALGFHEVYDMLGGIEAFAVLPGAGPYLVP
jgi:alpha-tubulin suppressor-like RCC1 family protein/rhodanese-related sulfurtransferase